MDTPYVAKWARSEDSVHEQALRLRTRRFELLSANIANADTPNYKARDIDFSAELDRVMGSGQNLVHRGIPGKAARILRKKYSSSR